LAQNKIIMGNDEKFGQIFKKNLMPWNREGQMLMNFHIIMKIINSPELSTQNFIRIPLIIILNVIFKNVFRIGILLN
jgi:hypothetical protein